MNDTAPDELALAQYRMLGHDGIGWTEIRVLSKHSCVYVDNAEDFVRTVLSTCKLDTYVGINPRLTNKGHGENGSGTAEDVGIITAIMFDFDPVRPAHTGSTEDQRQEAIRVASAFRQEIDGVLASSGSGAHVYIPIVPVKVEDRERTSAGLRAYAETIKQKYSTETVRIDSTFDLPRITRCWGTHNSKSNRECYYLSGNTQRQAFDISRHCTPAAGPVGAHAAGDSADAFSDRFKQLKATDRHLAAILAGNSLHATRVQADFAMAVILLKAGFTQAQTAELMRTNPHGKAHTRSEGQLAREVENIYRQIKDELPTTSLETDISEYEHDLDTRKAGISTGFPIWDSMTAGLKPGRFYVEAGRPTDGKTTRLIQVAVAVAKQGLRVLYFPTEVSKASVYDKMVSADSGVSLRKFQYGSFTVEEKQSVLASARAMKKLPVIIAEEFSLTLDKVRQVTAQVSPDVLIVDFLQYMRYHDPNSSSELARNVAGIKSIGESRSIPVVLSSQLHRKPGDVQDSLSDLKGTGSLEELGDVVTFVRTVDAACQPAKSRLSIMKNKYGEPGSIDLLFYRETCTFREAPKDVFAMPRR